METLVNRLDVLLNSVAAVIDTRNDCPSKSSPIEDSITQIKAIMAALSDSDRLQCHPRLLKTVCVAIAHVSADVNARIAFCLNMLQNSDILSFLSILVRAVSCMQLWPSDVPHLCTCNALQLTHSSVYAD
ncbi:hypothetical protein N9L31_00090 [bacterium]|nr:hypothetical protein [bacterium]